MDEIFVIETGKIGESGAVENFWDHLLEAETYISARMITETESPFSRVPDKEDDTIVRYYENDDEYICIKVMMVD